MFCIFSAFFAASPGRPAPRYSKLFVCFFEQLENFSTEPVADGESRDRSAELVAGGNHSSITEKAKASINKIWSSLREVLSWHYQQFESSGMVVGI